MAAFLTIASITWMILILALLFDIRAGINRVARNLEEDTVATNGRR